MTWTLEKLRGLSPTDLRNLLDNARKRSGRPGADALVELIESSGLHYRDGYSVRLDDVIGKRISKIVFSEEGRLASIGAHEAGLPPLAGVDPILLRELGDDYGPQNEATSQAGYLVANLMRQLGYDDAGQVALPPNCVAKTGKLFKKTKNDAR